MMGDVLLSYSEVGGVGISGQHRDKEPYDKVIITTVLPQYGSVSVTVLLSQIVIAQYQESVMNWCFYILPQDFPWICFASTPYATNNDDNRTIFLRDTETQKNNLLGYGL